MQIQADLLGRPVEVASSPAASALGAARLAAEQLGVATPPVEVGRCVTPHAPTSDTDPARRVWRQAIARSRGMTVSQADSGSSDETIERNDP
jgi:glycerol kinase